MIKTTPVEEVFNRCMTPRERAKARVKTERMAERIMLRDLRKSLGITQKQLAESLKVSQPVISAMENREDFQLTTLRRVIQAMGGNMDVIARFGDRVVALHVA